MVRQLAAVLAALFLLSCGGARFAAPDREGFDDAVGDDPENAEVRFNAFERLRDNPVDPHRARVEELLAIPGFPASLAEEVVNAVHGSRPGKSWIDDLTPPERAELYRYDGLIILPKRRPTSLRERITADRLGASGRERIDSYSVCGGDDWRLLLRSRDFDLRRKATFYATGSVLSGAVRLHAGSFATDFGFGLVFGGGFGSDLLSGAYPFRGDRWIVGSTSFSERSLSGAAAELFVGKARAALVMGRPRIFGSKGFEFDGGPVLGGRFDARSGAWEAGAGAFPGAGASNRPIYSIDGRWKGAGVDIGLEIAGIGSGDPSCAWGASYRARRARLGLLFHAVPAGVCGAWGRINARPLAPSHSQRGIAASTEIEPLRRLHLRASLERYAKEDGFKEESKDALRVECERDGKTLSFKLSWSSRIDGTVRLIPYPGEGIPEEDSDDSFGLLSIVRMTDWLSGRISTRYAVGNGRMGLVVSPAVSVSLLSDGLKAECSYAVFRALEGKPLHYFSEPSLSGAVPWMIASGNGERAAFVFIYKFDVLSILSKAAVEAKRPPEVVLQAILDLH